MMNCLVTGGAGFIGSHTVDALLARGYRVRILDNLSKPVHLKGKPGYLPADAEFMLGDVRNKDDWEKALQGVDVVFHFAAYQDYLPDFSKFFYVNSMGTALLYEIIVEKRLNIQKVIVASSQAVYGEGKYRCPKCNRIKFPDLRTENDLMNGRWNHRCQDCGATLQAMWTNENRVNPQNQYALSKYSQEQLSLNLGKRYQIPTVCLRYSIVQGPRQSIYNAYSGACRIFSLSLFFDRQPPVYEDGNQVRDFVNIHDVVQANLKVLDSPLADYQVFNVGGGRTYSVYEFAMLAAKVMGKNISPKITEQYRFGDTRHIFSDISKLKYLGWRPMHTVEDSLREYMAWLSQMPDIDNVLDRAAQEMQNLNVIRSKRDQRGGSRLAATA
ncbi:MAG: NAD-dependent epimerase/dehydratase family protein [candidate division KSB1 bacterium]|nr:NAD-dependent epimerase/dehydratase family protein [candidate division KSB1 bacterium]MDZ7340888.1 NAD-dependent epimerase/dehydratase family protein [candidate division KSB1 bacterium]